MSNKETHFELFLRKSPKVGWTLNDAVKDRQTALERAKTLLRSYPNGGVRIIKEAHNKAENSYDSVVVTTLGNCDEPRKGKSRTFTPQNPGSCVSASDMSSPAARKTYLEVLPRFLEAHRILPGELVYRTDLLERLEASGSEITAAIQRVAIARAAGGDDLHGIARQLHDLANQAINIAFKDKKAGAFLKYEGSLEEVIYQARRKESPRKALASAFADKLMKATNWPDKLNSLLEIWREAEQLLENDRRLANELLSDLFSEWIEVPGALNAILGDTRDAGDVVDRLIAVLEPKPKSKDMPNPLGRLPAAQTLAEAIHLGLLPSARNTIITRIFNEISSNRRLITGSLLLEFQMLKKFGDRLVVVLQTNRRAEMYDAFCARSKRLMATDTVEAFLEDFIPIERPRMLLQLGDNLVGHEARAKLAALVRGFIGQPAFEAAVLNDKGNTMMVLSTLRQTQLKLLSSGLPEMDRIHGAQDIDSLAVRLVSQSQIIRQVARKAGSPVLASIALFRMASEALPKGRSAVLAASAAGKLLRSDDAQIAIKGNADLKSTLRDLASKAQGQADIMCLDEMRSAS